MINMRIFVCFLTALTMTESVYATRLEPKMLFGAAPAASEMMAFNDVAASADTVDVIGNEIEEKEYYAREGVWNVSFWNREKTMLVRLEYVSATFSGAFATRNFNLSMTYMLDYTSGEKQNVRFDSIAGTITETKDYVDIHLVGKSKEGVIYNMHMHKSTLTPKHVVDLTFSDVALDVEDDWFMFDGYSDNAVVRMKIANKTGAVRGEYTTQDFYPLTDTVSGFVYVDKKTAKVVHFVEAEATITLTNRVYSVKASMIGNDTVRYNVTMTYALPSPTDTIDIAINNLSVSDLTNMVGSFWLQGSNKEWNVNLIVDAAAMRTGTYDIQSVRMTDVATSTMVEVSDATVDVVVGKRVTAHAYVYSRDQKLYSIAMAFVVPPAKDTVQVTVPNAEMINYLSNNAYQLHGMSSDGGYYVSIVPNTSKIEGTFEADDLNRAYSMVQYLNADKEVVNVTFVDGMVTATMSADSIITIQGRLQGTDTVLYDVILTGKYAEEQIYLEYDEVEGSVDRKYTEANEIAFTTDYVAKYGEMYVTLQSTEHSDFTSLVFFVKTVDPAITIPAGVYPIDDTYGDMTVLASSGIKNAQVTPSFYGHRDTEGMIVSPVFFFVSGTVTVENRNGHLYMEINAKNSYDRPIHIVYTGTQTEIRNTESEEICPQKVIENGQLIILRGDEKYSVMGTKLHGAR